MQQSPLHLELEIMSDFSYLPFLTRIFKTLKTKKAHAMTQILVEAFNNAVIHAHQQNKKRWIGIDIFITPKMGRIRVIDSGRGLKWKNNLPPTLWSTHGRGLDLIRAYADRITSTRRKGRHIFETICFYE